jgi:hypothetical protein
MRESVERSLIGRGWVAGYLVDKHCARHAIDRSLCRSASEQAARRLRTEDYRGEPQHAFDVVHQRQEQPDSQVGRTGRDELGKHCDVERTDLGVEQVGQEPSAPRAPGGRWHRSEGRLRRIDPDAVANR